MLVSKKRVAMFGLFVMLIVFLTGCVEKVAFEDKKLERIIRKGINKMSGELTKEELSYIVELDLMSKGISSLKGLENLKNLEKLDLDNNKIGSIEPLKNLTYLETLYMDNNYLEDITPLKGLTNLKSLYLEKNYITDITPLSNLANLTELGLGSNPIKDITPLANLTGLRRVVIPEDLPKTPENMKVIKKLKRNGTRVIQI